MKSLLFCLSILLMWSGTWGVTNPTGETFLAKSQASQGQRTKSSSTTPTRAINAQAWFNVRQFGAHGDGEKDDTFAIQRAIATAYAQGGGVVFFPPGVYLVTSVNIKEGITYRGDRATIKRPPYQPYGTRTFSTHKKPYGGRYDSPPLIIKDLTFDGNSKNQGPYQHYEQQHSHLLFFMADPTYPGRLKVQIENCTFRNGVGDAISVWKNVDITVKNCQAENVFRGGFVMTGGNSIARVTNFTTKGDIDPTGIDIEIDGLGYGNSGRVEVYLENINLIDGDFDFGVKKGSNSVLIGNNIKADAPFFLNAKESKVRITNSQFGVAQGNRLMFPKDVTFENCTFIATRKKAKNKKNIFHASPLITWSTKYFHGKNQTLTFTNCKFKVSKNIKDTHKVFGIYTNYDLAEDDNVLVVNGGHIEKGFDVGLGMASRGGNWRIKNTLIEADLAVSWDGFATKWGGAQFANIELNGIKVTGRKYMHIGHSQPHNRLKQTNIIVDESSNFLLSQVGLEKNTYIGHRTINGSNPPTPETHGLPGDIFRLKNSPAKWLCEKPGYYKQRVKENIPAVWVKKQ